MKMNEIKYTLWTIPKSEWSHFPLQDIEISDAEKNEMISFAKELDDERLKDLLRPFNKPITQNMLYKFIERNPMIKSQIMQYQQIKGERK